MYLVIAFLLIVLILLICVFKIWTLNETKEHYKQQNSHKLWIYTDVTNEESKQRVQSVMTYLNDKKLLNQNEVLCVDHKDVTLKIATNTLSIFIGDVEMKCPQVVWCRISSDKLRVDVHITTLRQLELMGAKIVNSIDAIEKLTNKVWHLQNLAKNGIPIATTLSYNDNLEHFRNVQNTLTYPIVTKMIRGNGGNKVFLIQSKTMHTELLGVLKDDLPYLYQEYIAESHGKDIRVIVVGGNAVFTMIRESNNESIRANLSGGGKGTVITGQYPDIEAFAVKIHNILGLDISGVDLLKSNKYGLICCEVNNSPGFSKAIYSGSGVEKAIGEYLFKCVQNETK